MTRPEEAVPRVLGLFAKWPAPAAVKTRLAAATSPAFAARVAHAFLEDTLTRLSTVSARRLLAFAPLEAESLFAELTGDRCALVPQAPGDLGQRLAAFLQAQLTPVARPVVILGTDSPTLPLSFVEQAFSLLIDADVVLGPATDGGYYLLGCRRWLPCLFKNIDWSSPQVLAQTVAGLADASCRLALLPPWYDVDSLTDWQMLTGHLAALRRAGVDPGVPFTEALMCEPLPLTPPAPSPP